jgi:murein L,D-transpeptidase YafK
MRRYAVPAALGLALVSALWFLGNVGPLSLSTTLNDWRQRIATEQQDRFDRAPLRADLAAAGLALGEPAYVRIFKREKRLEIWMQPQANAPYVLFRSYAVCTFSGALGPKLREGDHQAPEGFYRVTAKQLNPNSRHHLAFNLGFPNALDRQLGRTGSLLMVHGGCTSVGCFAMGDAQVDEIYAVVEAALRGGQPGVDVAVFPYDLSGPAAADAAAGRWTPFWDELKRGSDLFAATGVPPVVAACAGRYRFGDEAAGPGCEPIAGWA